MSCTNIKHTIFLSACRVTEEKGNTIGSKREREREREREEEKEEKES
jgi:hypothetical protein